MKIVRILAFTVIFVLLFSFDKSTAENQMDYPYGHIVDVFPCDDGFCVLSELDGNYNVSVFNNESEFVSYSTDISARNGTYAYCNETIHFFTSNAEVQDKNIFYYVDVNIFDCHSGITSKRVINDVNPRTDTSYAYDGTNYYINCPSKIEVCSSKFLHEYTINPNAFILDMEVVSTGNILCASTAGVLKIKNEVETFPIESQNIYVFGEYFSDDNSRIYYSENGHVVFDGFDKTKGNAKLGDWFIGQVRGKLVAVKDDISVEIGSAYDYTFICQNGDSCACFTHFSDGLLVDFITLDEIEQKYAESIVDSQNEEENPIDSEESSETESENPQKEIVYCIYKDDKIITGVEPKTTFTKFCKILNDKDAVLLTAGHTYVGTGTEVMLSDGITYTILIYGDLTGEGNINSRDVRVLKEYLLDNGDIDDIYFYAADVISDGEVDLKDLTAIYRYSKGKYFIDQSK